MSIVAVGTAVIPEAEPTVPVEVVVPLDQAMPNTDYDVSILQSVYVAGADVEVTLKEELQVTLSATYPDGFAGTALVHVVCVREVDSGWIDATPYLDAGWAARLPELPPLLRLAGQNGNAGGIVYFAFDLVPQASMDGVSKHDGYMPILTSLSGTPFGPTSMGHFTGTAFDDGNQVFAVAATDGVLIEGTASVTGDWADGVGFLRGQVSWVTPS